MKPQGEGYSTAAIDDIEGTSGGGVSWVTTIWKCYLGFYILCNIIRHCQSMMMMMMMTAMKRCHLNKIESTKISQKSKQKYNMAAENEFEIKKKTLYHESTLCMSLSKWHGTSSDCGCWRQLPDMGGSCIYIE
jgi:hypothetical protein